ncbi:MAG TPA: type VI secretion system tip protein TssI/VgrG [Ottowia sp.]|uniref:type VI secretion system Vgr family protein n=1 Tax=Ottowia sp. TaxID=1898956 RepID=UPI002C8F21FF|nr:type VI secretion system tip protein TssI/VgrG [Ottowia sp.]HMN20136.1 type VI secretion system tip protein TssI/VgrG [Ottowia sp.]
MADDLYEIKSDAPAASDLMFWSLLGHESLSRPSCYELTVLSEKKTIAAGDVLGHPFDVIVRFDDPGQARHERHCQGHAVRFRRERQVGRYYQYRLTLVSWFGLLAKRRNARILQDKPVLEVLDAVLEDSPVKRFKKTNVDQVIDTHKPHRYCVQFEESDQDFLARLLEEEGIYYWFDAHDAPGTMRLADTSSVAHEPLPVIGTLEYRPFGRGDVRFGEIIAWIAGDRLETGKWAALDSNFKTIRKKLDAEADVSAEHELADFEEFEFPGDYFDADQGELAAQWRGDELQARRTRHWAVTEWPDVAAGRNFKYQGDPDASRNGEYLIGSCTFVLVHAGYEGMGDVGAAAPPRAELRQMLAGDAFNQGNPDVLQDLAQTHLLPRAGAPGARLFVLGLAPQSVPYKPPRLTPRVRMPGPQSAIVVGPDGEELHVDEFGRVKVHFHWDRYDERNEKSTCWIRVSQPWAGQGWGGYFAPRIGQEVIVDFLNGDPDRPIIMGRVYNDDQPIPYDSPTQSGFKTRSTPGGGAGNCNELRFEDKKGSEQVFLHAEKNQDIEVENDETHWVGNDRKKKVDNNEQTKIGNNRIEEVGSNEDISIGGNRNESVGADEAIKIGGSRAESVAASESVTIGADRDLTVGGSETVIVGASRTELIGADLAQTIAGGVTQTVAGAVTQTIGGALNVTVGGPATFTAAGGFTIVAPGGTKIIDMELSQMGGTIKEGYAMKFDFNGISNEANAAKTEMTGFTAAAIGAKAETVGAELKSGNLSVEQMVGLEALSTATGIEMDTLKVFL